MEELAEDCGNGLESKRKRVASDSSTQTTMYLLSDGDSDSRSEDTYRLDINTNEHMNKCDKFQTMNHGAPGYKEVYKTKWYWKFLFFVPCILVIIMVIAFFWEFNQIRDIKSKLLLRDIKTPMASKSIQDILSPPDGFTAISLTGNGQLEKGRKGIPILNWKLHYRHGNIAFTEGKKIHIMKTGLYNLYAQMFFYRNAFYSKRNVSDNRVMDFGITKVHTNERVIAATVSLSSCKLACTRHISRIVRLEKNEILTVDTRTTGVYFKMIEERSLFGTYLISEVETATKTAFVP